MPFLKHGRGQPLGIVEVPHQEAPQPPETPEPREVSDTKKPSGPRDNKSTQGR